MKLLTSGHPGYNMSLREKVLCTLRLHRDTVTDNTGVRYCGRCGRSNPTDIRVEKGRQQLYADLVASGLSDSEARGTAWP